MAAYGDAGLGLLGDPSRRAIFELLAREPCSVQELADRLPISRPAVSQHLRVLRDGGLVISQAEGTRRIYRLNPDGVEALRTWLDGVGAPRSRISRKRPTPPATTEPRHDYCCLHPADHRDRHRRPADRTCLRAVHRIG